MSTIFVILLLAGGAIYYLSIKTNLELPKRQEPYKIEESRKSQEAVKQKKVKNEKLAKEKDAQEREEKELDFSIEYKVSEYLESELVYAQILADEKADDQDKLVFIVKYKF